MLGRLFGRAKAAPEPAVRRMAAVPPGIRVYAVGDVHGRLDLLQQLFAMIAQDIAARGSAEVHLVMLGDLVDRGPESAGVIELLTRRPPWAHAMHLLRGNHEDTFLAIAEGDREELPGWLQFGGVETLESYGISARTTSLAGPMFDAELRARVPAAHLKLLRDMHECLQIGDYLFVHAGIRPGVALDRQDARDLYWIRQDFLRSEVDHGVMVVHGHSISEDIEERWNRIGIDTGAYASGRLTALALEGVERWYLQTREPDLPPRSLV